MPYFLFDGNLELDKDAWLSGPEAQHLLYSRRVKVGEIIELQDHQGRHFLVVLEKLSRDSLSFHVQKELAPLPPSPLKLEIVIGVTKEKALDWIIQKGTELGVSHIVFFNAQYSPRTIAAGQQEKVMRRWKKIAQEACKQSGRATPPEISLFSDLKAILTSTSSCQQEWVLTFASSLNTLPSSSLLDIPRSPDQTQRVLIGPEGGLHPDELDLAYQHGMQGLHLGKRVLRSETAMLAMSTLLQFLFGDLSRGKL